MAKFFVRIVCIVVAVFCFTYCDKRQVEKAEGPKTIPLPEEVGKTPQKEPTLLQPAGPVTPVDIIVGRYHGNKKTKMFHVPECPDYDCPNCTLGFRTKRQARRNGYKPHNCVEPKKSKRKIKGPP